MILVPQQICCLGRNTVVVMVSLRPAATDKIHKFIPASFVLKTSSNRKPRPSFSVFSCYILKVKREGKRRARLCQCQMGHPLNAPAPHDGRTGKAQVSLCCTLLCHLSNLWRKKQHPAPTGPRALPGSPGIASTVAPVYLTFHLAGGNRTSGLSCLSR